MSPYFYYFLSFYFLCIHFLCEVIEKDIQIYYSLIIFIGNIYKFV